MSVSRLIPLLFVTMLVSGCGTLEDSAWMNGIPLQDAYAIRDVVHAAHPNCQIVGYSRDSSHVDRIYCYTSCKTYLLRRTRSGWTIVPGVTIVTVV